MRMSPANRPLASRIEQTLLTPEATPDQVDRLCDEVVQYEFGGICVNPCYIRQVARRLSDAFQGRDAADVPRIVSVAGFPFGANHSATKADEARRILDDGANDVDMVVALGALRSGDATAVRRDIETVARAVHGAGRGNVLKVILETGLLTTEQVILGCRCAMEGEADFVKTSTGFHPSGGATVEHVRLLHRYGSPMRVKAAGGIRTTSQARTLIDAGADRLGTSAGPAILDGA